MNRHLMSLGFPSLIQETVELSLEDPRICPHLTYSGGSHRFCCNIPVV